MASIFDFFKRENRAISYQTIWGEGGEFATESNSGVTINGKTAFEIVAFFSAVSLISDTISTLPVDAFIRIDGDRKPYRPRPAWVDQPDVDTTRQAHYGSIVTSLLVYGNSYTRVYRNRQGEVTNLVALDPNTVRVERSAIGRKVFYVGDDNKPLTSDEIIHIIDLAEPGALVGISRVNKLKDALGVATALQNYASKFFSQGATTQGVIEFPGNLTPEQAKNLAEGFDSRHKGWRRSHKTGVLSGGATYKPTQVPNDQAQFLDSRRFAVEEMARAFNIPLHMMGIPGTASYSSVEQNNLQFVSHTLRPILEKIEWSYSKLLPTPAAFIKFNFNALLRGDLQSRMTSYSIGSQAGFMSVNDVRRLEDLSPVEQGDQYRVPLANIALTQTAIIEEEKKVKMAQILVQVGYAPEDVLAVLGLPEIPHTGLPSTQLQAVAQIDPENPQAVY
jgi:HK97 family phage portal protein